MDVPRWWSRNGVAACVSRSRSLSSRTDRHQDDNQHSDLIVGHCRENAADRLILRKGGDARPSSKEARTIKSKQYTSSRPVASNVTSPSLSIHSVRQLAPSHTARFSCGLARPYLKETPCDRYQ